MAEYSLTLRVHTERLPFLKWITPGRHQITPPQDGGDWHTARVQTESVELAKMLVFGLGAHAEVIEPRSLYDAVLQMARDFCNRFPAGHHYEGSKE